MSTNFYSTRELPNFVKLDVEEMEGEEQGKVVVPGQSITDDASFMSGFGTYKDSDGVIRSSVAGRVKILNKLIISTSLRARYSGEIGDVVVARVTEVAQKRWKVDVNSTQDGILLLSSVILPGGIQRRKSDSDELKMRTYLTEGDLLCEVQQFYQDGSLGLHTRSTKYGKLGQGQLVKIPPLLVQRARSHFLTLSCDVSVILALNGYVFVSKHNPQTLNDLNYDVSSAPLTDTDRDTLARVSNAIRGLAVLSVPINEKLLNLVFEVSLKYSAKDLLVTRTLVEVVQEALLLSQQ